MRVFILAIMISLAACAKKEGGGGVTDVGGGVKEEQDELRGDINGDFPALTEIQVVEAIERARAFLASEEGARLVETDVPSRLSREDETVREAYAKIAASRERLLSVIKIDYRSEALCSEPTVTVCFNVARLRHLEPTDLDRQMIALWLGELARLNGYPEDVAKLVAEWVLK